MPQKYQNWIDVLDFAFYRSEEVDNLTAIGILGILVCLRAVSLLAALHFLRQNNSRNFISVLSNSLIEIVFGGNVCARSIRSVVTPVLQFSQGCVWLWLTPATLWKTPTL